VPRGDTLDDARDALMCVINEERAKRDLVRFKPKTRLTIAARRHSRQMVKNQFFAHDDLDGHTFVDRIRRTGYLRGDGWSLGETLAWGSGDLATPGAVLAGWLKSAPHRRIVLSPGLRHIGIGLVAGTPTGMAEGTTVTADFGCRAPAHC
jgi:uncharacterized protein YkwD